VTDAGVGALCARSAVMGAFLNVKVNAAGLKDKLFVEDILKKGTGIEEGAKKLETELLALVNSKIS
jgi:glutamate formiminotransferase/formiminotetrahydrofolate cyclodeaminase